LFDLNQIFLFKSDFFQKNRIFAFFSLYCAVKHHSQDCGKSLKRCTLHRIKVPEPVTVKSVVGELNKLNKKYDNTFASVL